MQANPASPIPSNPPPMTSGTVWGAISVRRALSRLRGLAAIALAASVLVLLLDALNYTGVVTWGPPPSNPQGFADWWTFGVGIGVLVAIGIAIVVLVITGVVYAITGVTAWRRGVLAMNNASFEYGPEHVKAARQAREDHSLTLWMVVLYIAVGIAVSIVGGAFSAILDNANLGPIPGAATTVASNLAGSVVLVFAYYFGARNLVGMLFGLSTQEGQRRLARGRDLLLAGALIGLGGAFTPISWGFGAVIAASLAIILIGANDLVEAYNDWLGGLRIAPEPIRGPQATPV